jgi:hypothetical protein
MKKQICIYVPIPLEQYELCQPVNHAEFDKIIVQLNGISRKSTWQPITMEIIHEDEGRKFLESDAPWLGPHALIFRQAAVQTMGQMLNEFGELLPLQCDEAELSIFNATQILDALDEAASSIVRFSTGRIMTIERYAFRPDTIKDNHIFKIPNLRASPTFVSNHFAQLWKSSGLKGLGFTKVWSF